MAGTSPTAHTRLVPAKRRADTRARTEPRSSGRPLGRGTGSPPALTDAPPKRPGTFSEETTPYPRTFEPEQQGRESLPYLEMTILTKAVDPEAATEAELPTEASAKVDPEDKLTETRIVAMDPDQHPTAALPKLLRRDSEDDELETMALPKVVVREHDEEELEHATERVVKMLESLTEPNGPKPRPSKMSWLGVVLTPPEIGAALVIGTWLRPEFCVTSPVTHVFPRESGTLVQTSTKSRYFVGPDGDTYLIRKLA
jgi:hypothetical protein